MVKVFSVGTDTGQGPHRTEETEFNGYQGYFPKNLKGFRRFSQIFLGVSRVIQDATTSDVVVRTRGKTAEQGLSLTMHSTSQYSRH